MARTTKPLSGAGKDKFLRTLVAGVEGVPDVAADAVTLALVSTITEVRVRRDVWEAQARAEPAPRAKRSPQGHGARAEPQAGPERAAVDSTPVAPVPAVGMASEAAFDPFAFSVVATLTKKGKAGLMAELARISSIEHLKRIADAQHLGVDPAIADAEALRAAIHDGAARRIAERRAAAR